MIDNATSFAIKLLDQRNFKALADYCEETIKKLADAGSSIDPRLYACQALAAAHFGFFDRTRELLKIVWKHKRQILKWGIRGIKFISLIATLIAVPQRFDFVLQQMADLMREA